MDIKDIKKHAIIALVFAMICYAAYCFGVYYEGGSSGEFKILTKEEIISGIVFFISGTIALINILIAGVMFLFKKKK